MSGIFFVSSRFHCCVPNTFNSKAHLIFLALQMNRGQCIAVKFKTKKRLILCCVAAVAAYAIFDLTDSAVLLRQLAILPIIAVPATLSQLNILPICVVDVMLIDELDVDTPGIFATVVRISAFSALLFLIVTPAYLYVTSKRKVYLVWLWIMAGWLVIAVCWFFLVLIGISGMLE
jgi:hypothetical protein